MTLNRLIRATGRTAMIVIAAATSLFALAVMLLLGSFFFGPGLQQ
jgi:hypothetical protein